MDGSTRLVRRARRAREPDSPLLGASAREYPGDAWAGWRFDFERLRPLAVDSVNRRQAVVFLIVGWLVQGGGRWKMR